MSRFNLLEENWIRVLEAGEMKEVSLITLFENAEKYRCLAGEM
ncbi:MAG: type I-E CRISPR-associated protein Cse1/CasA, partial [Oribacterium sinus]|nr:type I-E CRISPR-associated protein Cse1/CasA [Oribacterium sinus]